MNRAFVVQFAVSSCLTLAACGDDGGGSSNQAARACDVSCTKLVECGLTGGLSHSACVDLCRNNTGGDNDCNVSESQANACISAYESTTCAELQSGTTPAACQNLCPNQQNDTVGGDTTPTLDTTPAEATESSCGDLAACCAHITNADAKQGCDGVAASQNQSLCAQTLSGYRAAQLCN